MRDEVFDREEKLFRGLEKAVRQLVKNVHCYLQQTQVGLYVEANRFQLNALLFLMYFFVVAGDGVCSYPESPGHGEHC